MSTDYRPFVSIRRLTSAAFAVLLAAGAGAPARATVTYTITDLGTLGGSSSSPSGINASGQVVGYSYTAGNLSTHAFLYSDGAMVDLNSLTGPASGWQQLDYAQGINDAGQIVGYGINAAGQTHAFLMTPDVAAVPEPSTLATMGLALAATGLVARRRAARGR